MSCGVSKGRLTPCNNGVSGIKNIYLYNFSYSWGVFDVIINECELIKVPTDTILYKYVAIESSFTETDNIEDEGISFEQTLDITLTGYDYELALLPNKLISAVIEMYDGTFRAIGVKNGLDHLLPLVPFSFLGPLAWLACLAFEEARATEARRCQTPSGA